MTFDIPPPPLMQAWAIILNAGSVYELLGTAHYEASIPASEVRHILITRNNYTAHIELLKMVELSPMTCRRCGDGTWGRQWKHQPEGSGICIPCAQHRAHELRYDEVQYRYGIKGFHWGFSRAK